MRRGAARLTLDHRVAWGLAMWALCCASCDSGPGAAADPYAGRVVSFQPGPGAGYGQERLPQVVLGPPSGGGPTAGGLDVLSLGQGGSIVLELTEDVVDGPGPDLLVFENPFPGNEETGLVAVSLDGATFQEWPCDPLDAPGGYPGCAGVRPVLSAPDNGIPATDPARAGGDAFDLLALGVPRARFVRIRDSGRNRNYSAPTGGFDLDAIAVLHGAPRAP